MACLYIKKIKSQFVGRCMLKKSIEERLFKQIDRAFNPKQIQKLLQLKADPNAKVKQDIPMICWILKKEGEDRPVSEKVRLEALKLLITAGARWQDQDPSGLGALDYAAKSGHSECLEWLVNAFKEDISDQEVFRAWHSACIRADQKHFECIKTLLGLGRNLWAPQLISESGDKHPLVEMAEDQLYRRFMKPREYWGEILPLLPPWAEDSGGQMIMSKVKDVLSDHEGSMRLYAEDKLQAKECLAMILSMEERQVMGQIMKSQNQSSQDALNHHELNPKSSKHRSAL